MLIELSLHEVKQIIENPLQIPPQCKDLLMYSEEGTIIPAHVPQLPDTTHIPPVFHVPGLSCLEADQQKGEERGRGTGAHDAVGLGSWLDPTVSYS